MIGVGYFLTLVYVFFIHTRLPEIIAPSLSLPQLAAIGALSFAFLSSTIVRPFVHRVGIALLLLTGWFFVALPFGAYPSASLMYLLNVWSKNMALFVLVVALVNSRRHCSRMLIALAFGSTVVAVAAMVIDKRVGGRLVLGDTSLNDPNTLGMTLLLGIPMWMVVIADRSRLFPTRMIAALCVIPILVAIPFTGSRGTLVAALMVVAYLFKRFSIGGKMGLAVIVALVGLSTASLIGDKLLDRYSTLGTDQLSETASTESRTFLFKQGLRLIARNPIFGVGVSQFAVAENELALQQGYTRGTWHTCHNMYLQVASEGGPIGFVIYGWILWTVWKRLSQMERLRRDEHPRAAEIVRLAFWTKITYLAFCACGVFLSVGLSPNFLMLVAIPVALERVVRSELSQLEEEKSAEEKEPLEEIAPLPRFEPVGAPVRGLRG